MKTSIKLITFTIMMCIASCGGSKSENSNPAATEIEEKVQPVEEQKSNGTFEIISFSKDSVKFKTEKETKFYTITLISGDESYEGKGFSNSVGTVRWANGSQFLPVSSMSLPSTFNMPAMTLPEGAVLTIYRFGTPEDFKPAKIEFNIDGTEKMYYNIPKLSWDK